MCIDMVSTNRTWQECSAVISNMTCKYHGRNISMLKIVDIFASVNITVLGLTNPDVNLKRMHQFYNVVDKKNYSGNSATLMSWTIYILY